MADAPRRRRWPRRLLISSIAFALLLFFAPAIASHTGLTQNQANQAFADFDGSITVGSTTLGWLLPVELHDVTLKDAQGRTLATIPRIVTSQSLLGFLDDSQNSGTVTLEQPTFEIVCEHDATNLEASLKKLLEKPGDPNAPSPKITIVLTNATLKIIDSEQKKDWTLSEIEATAELGESVHLKAAIRKPESLEIDAVFGNEFAATLCAERFSIEVLGPLLRRFEPGLRLAGTLSGQIASENSIITGSLSLRNLIAESPRLDSERLGIAKSSQAEGLISFDLEENRITLADWNRAAMKGKLTLHNVSITPGPVITEVAKLFNQSQAKMTLAQDQIVAIRVENGRIYHENLVLALGNFAIAISGSVGFDGTLSLRVQVPLPESEIGPLLKSVPAIRDAVVNKRVTVPITGTLTKPLLDGPAYRAAVRQFVREATREAAKSKLGDLLRPPSEKRDPKKP